MYLRTLTFRYIAVRAATKAKTDSAKAKNNGRFAKKIIMAVKAGGADPEVNRNLAGVIADAKVFTYIFLYHYKYVNI